MNTDVHAHFRRLAATAPRFTAEQRARLAILFRSDRSPSQPAASAGHDGRRAA